VPEINWTADNGKLIWALIPELEQPENFKVYLRKKDKNENTTGESKAKVAWWMGKAILLAYAKINPKVVGDQVKSRLEA
ncbi:hypothetical protein F5148DRAFT_963915, partial [Russula earlei]